MKNAKLKRLKQLGLAIVGAYVLVGCPSSNATSRLFTADSDLSQENTNGVATAQAAETDVTNALEFEVCAAVDSWQRPTDEQQAKQLGEDARYAGALEPDSQLKRASEQFWTQQAVSFITYGLSARMEPINLSGVWTVADELEACYTPETTVSINAGDRAETWLLNQRITSLQWEGDRYVMTVEPAPTGMQVIQFDRVDELAELPLDVVTNSGTTVEVVSGDWQQ